ncbi:hypothetical protein [Paenibacillus sp. NPDC057967]|uniref:hypothetical protein n=1 Tax=Paenibacillus sp. NPDC057967 TaxID=3346293 RepID=UPI0036DAEC64
MPESTTLNSSKALISLGFCLITYSGFVWKIPAVVMKFASRKEKKTGTMVGAIVNQVPVFGGLGTVFLLETVKI